MIPPHKAVLLGLASLPAVVYYVVSTPDPVVSIAAVNVLLITASLYVAFGALSDTTTDHPGQPHLSE